MLAHRASAVAHVPRRRGRLPGEGPGGKEAARQGQGAEWAAGSKGLLALGWRAHGPGGAGNAPGDRGAQPGRPRAVPRGTGRVRGGATRGAAKRQPHRLRWARVACGVSQGNVPFKVRQAERGFSGQYTQNLARSSVSLHDSSSPHAERDMHRIETQTRKAERERRRERYPVQVQASPRKHTSRKAGHHVGAGREVGRTTA